MKDSIGDRMKDLEHRFRHFLPRRAYTIIRLDGKAFHTFTRGFKRPFDYDLISMMQNTTLKLCKEVEGCRMGYCQSDEITLLLTDFTEINTQAWFDGNISKILSISASIATAEFNRYHIKKYLLDHSDNPGLRKEEIEEYMDKLPTAKFDSRVYSTSDPWEVFNSYLWRQQDATRNSVQMVAQSLYSHKELQGKNISALQEMIHQKGQNWNDYPTFTKRGTFFYKDSEWIVDKDMPILTQDKEYFFSKLPLIPQPCLTKE